MSPFPSPAADSPPQGFTKGRSRPRQERVRRSSHLQASPDVPRIVLVGRTNVGKSTLFNRLVGFRRSIEHDRHGVTRDRCYQLAEIDDRTVVFVDTGGLSPEGELPSYKAVAEQAEHAMAEASMLIAVFDATTEPTDADHRLVDSLRRLAKPTLYVVNKADSPRRSQMAQEYYRLGIEHLVCVSAAHGLGLGDLVDALLERLPTQSTDDRSSAHEAGAHQTSEQPPEASMTDEAKFTSAAALAVALVGRPNAGKSSLLNCLTGSARATVDSQPGTTVDPVDSRVNWNGMDTVLVDTAGIRRNRRAQDALESLSRMQSAKSIDRCDIAVLVIDGHSGVTEQDARLARQIEEAARGLVIAVNKADLMNADSRRHCRARLEDVLRFVPWAQTVTVSAARGSGLGKLGRAVAQAGASYKRRIGTGELNRFFSNVIEGHPPPAVGGRSLRIYYLTQARTSPPLFVAKVNRSRQVPQSYRRYLVNQLRQHFDFRGSPVVLKLTS